MSNAPSTLAAHALLIGLLLRAGLHAGNADLRPALLELLGGRGNVLTQRSPIRRYFSAAPCCHGY
jgi:hypothetical protein